MKTTKVMRLIDPKTGKMKCQVCGKINFARTRYRGGYYRRDWKCINGCSAAAIPKGKKTSDKQTVNLRKGTTLANNEKSGTIQYQLKFN